MEQEEYRKIFLPIVNDYFKNDTKKLKAFVDKVIKQKFGGISGKDMDRYYSIADEVMAETLYCQRYDPSKGDFEGFLYNALVNAFIDDGKWYTRDKRCTKIQIEVEENGQKVKKRVVIPDARIDAPLHDNEEITLGDTIKADFDIDTEIIKKSGETNNEQVQTYLRALSDTSRKIAELIMAGCKKNEIKRILHLTDKQYQAYKKEMTSYEKKRILYEQKNDKVGGNEMSAVSMEDIAERYKNTSYSILSISKQIQKKRIRDDHILQRHSGQWRSFAKSELVKDILKGKSLLQIIIDEEVKGNIRMMWLIDGKQRCTTLDDYLHDGFAISKNIKEYSITYQTAKKDENGEVICNEDGFPEHVLKEFDIRGKKFSQLPEELQDAFRDRQIPVLYNQCCTKKDIADDIARFNRSRSMNVSQTGWLGLDEDFAELAERIANMNFFQKDFVGSSYTDNNRTSGVIRRIVIESIMVCDFIDYFNDFNKMCEFLTDEASDSNFTDFYCLVERLTEVCTEEISDLFNAKDSFIWFGLFSKFIKTDFDDKRFVDFMIEFKNDLHSKEIDGVSYDMHSEKRATKDKSVIIAKLNHLEKLMNDFLGISKEDIVTEDTLEFVRKNVSDDIPDDDIDVYEETLDDLTVNVDNSSELLSKNNRLSLVAIVAYSYVNEIDLDKWIVDYFSRNKTYLRNQKENFIHMRQDLQDYVTKT